MMRRVIFSRCALAAFVLVSSVATGRAGPIKPSSAAERAPVRYASGASLQYAYTASLSLARGAASRPPSGRAEKAVGFTVNAVVNITPAWQKDGDTLLKLEVTSATAASTHAAAPDESPLKAMSASPIFFHWHERGEVVRVFAAAAGDAPVSVNFKKGIVSLLQLQAADGERREVDVSGDCQAKYVSEAANKIRKSKQQCKLTEGSATVGDSLLGARVNLVSETVYELADERLTSATSSELYSVAPNFDVGSRIAATSRQTLKLTGQTVVKKGSAGGSSVAGAADVVTAMKLISKALRLDFVETTLALNSDTLKCSKHCSSSLLSGNINNYLKSMKNDKRATPETAKSFLTLLPMVRQATFDELLSALQSSGDAELHLVDVVAFAQTEVSTRALMAYIDFSSSYDQIKAERYLSAVSLSRRPHVSTVQSLMVLYDKSALSPKLHESVGLSLGASAAALSQSADNLSLQVVESVEKVLESSLGKCSDDPCRASVLGAVRNSRLPGLTAAVLRAAERSTDLTVAFEAVRAAGAIAVGHLASSGKTTEQDAAKRICKAMNAIFHKSIRNYDGTVRAAALEVILSACQPTTQELVNLILSTVNQTDVETSAFVQSRLLDMAKSDIKVRKQLDLLAQKQMVWNFNTRATGGKSSAFVNRLGETGGATLGYGLRIHNALNGIMKRTTFELVLSPPDGGAGLPLIATDLYAHGLESLIGTNNADSEKESEASATESSGGMVLALAGVGLRPIEFFGRSSGLMSAVWNAPSSPVSALTMNALMLDFNQEIHLQNGFVLDATMSGVTSLDLSGAIAISLWNRDAHSDVFTQSAVMTSGGVSLKNNQFLSLGVSFENEMTTKLSLVTDVNFYKRPIKMCLQLAVDPYVVRHRWSLHENHRGRGKKQTTTLLRHTKYSGASYPLGSEISAQCRALQSA